MASICRDPGGRRRILFVAPDGNRKAIRLGKVPQKVAEAVNSKMEALLAYKLSGCPWDAETARWVAELPDDLARRLAAVGLIPKREPTPSESLGGFLDSYIAGRANLKPNTQRNYEVTRKHLLDYFKAGRPLSEITPGDADIWKEHLLAGGMSPATLGREVKRARQFFRAAVRRKLLQENPFADVAAPPQVNTTREHFVTREVIQKVLDACPDAQWRLLVALSRYGGLRCPSEHSAMRCGDVDWEQDKKGQGPVIPEEYGALRYCTAVHTPPGGVEPPFSD